MGRAESSVAISRELVSRTVVVGSSGACRAGCRVRFRSLGRVATGAIVDVAVAGTRCPQAERRREEVLDGGIVVGEVRRSVCVCGVLFRVIPGANFGVRGGSCGATRLTSGEFGEVKRAGREWGTGKERGVCAAKLERTRRVAGFGCGESSFGCGLVAPALGGFVRDLSIRRRGFSAAFLSLCPGFGTGSPRLDARARAGRPSFNQASFEDAVELRTETRTREFPADEKRITMSPY